MRRVYLILLVIGAALRIWQFAAGTSLYIDEIAIARAILKQPAWTLLTQPLADQVAPKGFLLALKGAVWILGPSDQALRAFPLLCSLASLVVFWRIAVRLRGWGGPMALGLFAAAIPLIKFGAEVKQYAGDVFATVFLVWLVLRLTEGAVRSSRKLIAIAFAGMAAVCISHAAVLVVLSLAAVLLLTPQGREFLPVVGAWIVSAIAIAADAAHSVPTGLREYVQQVWSQGFMPLSWARERVTLWPAGQIHAILSSGSPASLMYPAPALAFGLIAFGLWWLWRTQRQLALCLLAPLAATLGAAVIQQYPFADRLILFLIPTFILAMSASADALREWISQPRVLGWMIYGAVIAAALWPLLRMPPVYHTEDMKAVFAYLKTEHREGDRIYTYYGAAPATAFYAPQYGLREEDYSVGGCHRGDSRQYFEELDRFRGSPRVWVLLTHSLPEFQEREDILRYLDAIGTRSEALAIAPRTFDNRGFPAEVYLYDLSDPQKLAQASAGSFPLLGPILPEAQSRCLYGPQVMIAPRGL